LDVGICATIPAFSSAHLQKKVIEGKGFAHISHLKLKTHLNTLKKFRKKKPYNSPMDFSGADDP